MQRDAIWQQVDQASPPLSDHWDDAIVKVIGRLVASRSVTKSEV